VWIRRWLDPPVAPTKCCPCYFGHILLSRALVLRRWRSRPPRLQLRHGLRRMTVAEAPRTSLHPSEASPLSRSGRDHGCSHRLGIVPRGRRGRPSPRSTRGGHKSAGIAAHSSVARSSPHVSLSSPPSPPAVLSPLTTICGRVPRNSFAPARAALHTPNSRHAPTSPLNAATRAHTSGRERARSTAQWVIARVVGAIVVCRGFGSGGRPIRNGLVGIGK